MAADPIVNHQEWARLGDLYNLFNNHAYKQTSQEGREALNLSTTRLLGLMRNVVQGSYGDIDGKPAQTAEEAMNHVLKPLDTLFKVAKENFNQAAGTAFDEIRYKYDGPAVLRELVKLHDDAVAAAAPKPK